MAFDICLRVFLFEGELSFHLQHGLIFISDSCSRWEQTIEANLTSLEGNAKGKKTICKHRPLNKSWVHGGCFDCPLNSSGTPSSLFAKHLFPKVNQAVKILSIKKKKSRHPPQTPEKPRRIFSPYTWRVASGTGNFSFFQSSTGRRIPHGPGAKARRIRRSNRNHSILS